MVEVGVGVVGLVFLEDLYDPSPRLVPLGLTLSLPDRFELLSLEPVLELLGGHVHGVAELVYDLLPVFVRHGRFPLDLAQRVGLVSCLLAALLALYEVAGIVF